MRRRDPRATALAVLVFLSPLILVKGTYLLTGGHPALQSVGAAVPPVGSLDPLVPVTPERTERQIRAARHASRLESTAFGPSPLVRRDAPPTTPEIATGPTPRPIVSIPDVTLQVILKSSKGNVALIDRKRYREGDALGDEGWTIERIHDRSVDIVHRESNGRATLVVR